MLRFVLLAERIWSFPISHTLSATALNQGIVQGSVDSPGIECGLLNFKVGVKSHAQKKPGYILFQSCFTAVFP